MATAVFEEGKDYVNEENEPELSKQKDYEAVFDTFDEEDRPRKLYLFISFFKRNSRNILRF